MICPAAFSLGLFQFFPLAFMLTFAQCDSAMGSDLASGYFGGSRLEDPVAISPIIKESPNDGHNNKATVSLLLPRSTHSMSEFSPNLSHMAADVQNESAPLPTLIAKLSTTDGLPGLSALRTTSSNRREEVATVDRPLATALAFFGVSRDGIPLASAALDTVDKILTNKMPIGYPNYYITGLEGHYRLP